MGVDCIVYYDLLVALLVQWLVVLIPHLYQPNEKYILIQYAISSPISWSIRWFPWKQVSRPGHPDESVRFALLIHRPPHLGPSVFLLLSFFLYLGHLSFISFAPWPRSLSNSWSNFTSIFLLLIFHIPPSPSLDFSQRSSSTSASHSFLHQRCIKALFFEDFSELAHWLVGWVGGFVSLQSVFFSEGMFFSFNFLIGFLHLLRDMGATLLLDL